jgi:hypothetical protein
VYLYVWVIHQHPGNHGREQPDQRVGGPPLFFPVHDTNCAGFLEGKSVLFTANTVEINALALKHSNDGLF